MLKGALIACLTGITVWLCQAFPNAAENSEPGLIMKLPEEVPGYIGFTREVSEVEKKWLPSDTEMVKKVFYPKGVQSQEEALNKSIAATLILSGSDKRSLHNPKHCLDGQGWKFVDKPVVSLEVNGKTLKVKDLYLEKTETLEDKSLRKVQAHYVYWWEGSHVSTPEIATRTLVSAKENIFENRNSRWGYPSIMTYVDLERGESRKDAQKRAYDFIQQYGTQFLKNYQ